MVHDHSSTTTHHLLARKLGRTTDRFQQRPLKEKIAPTGGEILSICKIYKNDKGSCFSLKKYPYTLAGHLFAEQYIVYKPFQPCPKVSITLFFYYYYYFKKKTKKKRK